MYLFVTGGQEVETDNAYVKANIVPISAAVTGRVIEVFAHDNERVEGGTVLFRMDPEPYLIAVAGARAQMEVVKTDVQSLRAEYRATLQEAAEARSRIEFLAKQMERQERLKEKGMTRGDTYDEARHNLEAAKRRLDSIREKTNRVVAELSGSPNTPVERLPRYAEAQSSYDAAMLDLARAQVKAPFAGVVSNMRLQVGEYVEKGAPMFSLIESGALWIEANYKETQLTHMTVGQPAKVVADAYPDHRMAGERRSNRIGHGCGICRVAATKCDRQLGQGRAAHTGAHQGRAAVRSSSASRRHDGDRDGRHGPAARDCRAPCRKWWTTAGCRTSSCRLPHWPARVADRS